MVVFPFNPTFLLFTITNLNILFLLTALVPKRPYVPNVEAKEEEQLQDPSIPSKEDKEEQPGDPSTPSLEHREEHTGNTITPSVQPSQVPDLVTYPHLLQHHSLPHPFSLLNPP